MDSQLEDSSLQFVVPGLVFWGCVYCHRDAPLGGAGHFTLSQNFEKNPFLDYNPFELGAYTLLHVSIHPHIAPSLQNHKP